MTTKSCFSSDAQEGAEQLTRLAEERERAWRAFDPGKLPGLANDWTRFAQANAPWEALYQRVYGGQSPESDWIDQAGSLWQRWYRYERTNAKEQPPARLVQAIEKLNLSSSSSSRHGSL